MKKILSLLLVVVMILGIAGCATKGEESASASASASVSASASSEASASAAQSQAPEGQPVIAIPYGPTEGKTDADYQFGFSFGGINPYADPVEPAATVAEQELGIKLHLLINTPQDWIQNDQNQCLDALIAAGCKGILMMPSEATASNEQITKMVNAGIPVVCMGGPPELPTDATLTLATDVYQSAYDGTVAVIEKMGGKGKIVGLSGAVNDTNTQKRFQAIQDAVAKYPDVELLQLIGDIDNAEGSMTAVGDVLAASGSEITGMISTAYYPSVAMAKYLAQEEYSHIVGVAIDTDEAVLDAIRNGVLYGTMSQNPWGQSYIGIYTLKMLVDGYTYKADQPAVVDSGSFLVTAENIDSMTS
jgi:ribose transport system substrate-binding protein